MVEMRKSYILTISLSELEIILLGLDELEGTESVSKDRDVMKRVMEAGI